MSLKLGFFSCLVSSTAHWFEDFALPHFPLDLVGRNQTFVHVSQTNVVLIMLGEVDSCQHDNHDRESDEVGEILEDDGSCWRSQVENIFLLALRDHDESRVVPS